MSDNVHAPTRALLMAELDAERFGHAGYLEWFYGDTSRGPALQQHVDDEETGRRIAHYGVIQTRFRHGAETLDFIFSTNVATDSTIRKSGLFRNMAEQMYRDVRTTGAPAMVGVGNDASTVVVVERFGWHLIAPMRATATWGMPSRSVRSHPVTEDFLASDEFQRVAEELVDQSVREWAQAWDAPFLRWRLGRPDGGYVLHVGKHCIGVSVKSHGPLGVPCAVLLKVWPRRGAKVPVSTTALVGATLRSHRAVVCVYAGWNANARVRGMRVPHRFQPSPLNVVLKVVDEERVDAETFVLETWELLDMDAY